MIQLIHFGNYVIGRSFEHFLVIVVVTVLINPVENLEARATRSYARLNNSSWRTWEKQNRLISRPAHRLLAGPSEPGGWGGGWRFWWANASNPSSWNSDRFRSKPLENVSWNYCVPTQIFRASDGFRVTRVLSANWTNDNKNLTPIQLSTTYNYTLPLDDCLLWSTVFVETAVGKLAWFLSECNH